MAGLSRELTRLVKAADDPEMTAYAYSRLNSGNSSGFAPPSDGDFRGRVARIRNNLSFFLVEQGIPNFLGNADEQKLASQLFQEASLSLIARRLRSQKQEDLRRLLVENNLLLRSIALLTVGCRHLHLERDLIERLKDPNFVIRDIAHQALVRVARGTDFGPFPGSSRRGMDRSIEKWNHWLALQQSASPGKSAKDTAIAAAGKKGKPATLEIVPLVLVHDEKPALASGVTKAYDELVNAKGDEQMAALTRMRDDKNSESTEALSLAIPKLSGDIQQQARDALIERLTRLSSAALRNKLHDDNPEVRSAAALACGRKIAKERIADLLQLLDDSEMAVIQSARVALTELSGEDFGPTSDSDRRGHAEAVAAWRKWWEERQRKNP